MRATVLLGLIACNHDLDSIREPCSNDLPCSNGLHCADDLRCVENLRPCVPEMVRQTNVPHGPLSQVAVPHSPSAGATSILVSLAVTPSDGVVSISPGTWTPAVRAFPAGEVAVAIEIWHAADVPATAEITVDYSAPKSGTVLVMEWTCVDEPVAVDASATAMQMNATRVSAGSVSTSRRNLVLAAFGHASAPFSIYNLVAPLGFGQRALLPNNQDNGGAVASGWVPPGTYEVTWALTEMRDANGVIAAFAVRAEP